MTNPAHVLLWTDSTTAYLDAIKSAGDASVLKQLASTMVDFDPRFPIMPGTKLRTTEPRKTDPFSATVGDVAAE